MVEDSIIYLEGAETMKGIYIIVRNSYFILIKKCLIMEDNKKGRRKRFSI